MALPTATPQSTEAAEDPEGAAAVAFRAPSGEEDPEGAAAAAFRAPSGEDVAQGPEEAAVVALRALSGEEMLRARVPALSATRDFKGQVAKELGVPAAALCLVHKGAEVADAQTWRELGADSPIEVAVVRNSSVLPSYVDVEKKTFDGSSRISLPGGACSEGNAARSVMVWLKNWRGGGAQTRLGWTVFSQGAPQSGKLFTVCALSNADGAAWVWHECLVVGQSFGGKGEWHHLVAVTWDERIFTMYYDGRQIKRVDLQRQGRAEPVFDTDPAQAYFGGVKDRQGQAEPVFDTDPAQAYFGGGLQKPRGNALRWFRGEAAALRVWNSTCIDQATVKHWMAEDFKEVHGSQVPIQPEVGRGVELVPITGSSRAPPSYAALERRTFDGASRLALPSGACSAGNAARSVAVWLNNGRIGNADVRLGWAVFSQGTMGSGKMFTVCARGDRQGMGVYGHCQDIWLGVGTNLWGWRTWHHLAVTWDGQNLTMYYDGKELGKVGPAAAGHRVVATFDTDSSQAFIGGGLQECGDNPQMKCFKGEVAGFRVWNSTCIDQERVRHWMAEDHHFCS